MYKSLLIYYSFCVCVMYATHELKAQQCSSKLPEARSVSGTFRGSWMQTRRGRWFQSYRGIRYAEPPVNQLRFQPPQLITSYQGVVDATEEGPGCPRSAPANSLADEDCLRINVYTPNNNSSKLLPVILYMHGGGFYSSTGRSDVIGPHYLLDRDVVLVTINYRLGSLGFLSLGTKLAPGNNGFKDQVAALRWIQRNIDAFGGDPDLVTISGCSAGAVSVMLHMISPMSKGLFHRAISMSGSPISKVPDPSDRLDLAAKQARVSNCPTDNTTALYECLMTKDWRDIHGSMLGFYEFGFDPVILWRQVVEPDFGQERFLDVQPVTAITQGRMHEVPFLVSMTTNEFFWKAFSVLKNQTLLNTMNAEWDRIAPISFILPRNESHERLSRLRHAYLGDKKLLDDEFSAHALGKLYGDSATAFPVHRMANLMCRHSKHPVFYSEFAYIGNRSHYEDPVTKRPVGVAHHDDLLYLFSMSYRFPMIEVADTPDSHMVDKMTAMWYNFARYGDPNPRGDTPELSSLHWPAMIPEQRNYLRVDRQFCVKQNLFEHRFQIWEELYPVQRC